VIAEGSRVIRQALDPSRDNIRRYLSVHSDDEAR
jgi:hypothetical protein